MIDWSSKEKGENELLAAFAHPTRVQILRSLSRGRRHLSQLSREVGLSHPGVLKHLNVLQRSGLVNRVVEDSPIGGRRTYYSITKDIAIRVTLGTNPPFFDVEVSTTVREPPDVEILHQRMKDVVNAVRKPPVGNVDWHPNAANINLAHQLSQSLHRIEELHQFLESRRRTLLDNEAKRILAGLEDLAMTVFNAEREQDTIDIVALADKQGMERRDLDLFVTKLSTRRSLAFKLLSLVQEKDHSIEDLKERLRFDTPEELENIIKSLVDARILSVSDDNVVTIPRFPVAITLHPPTRIRDSPIRKILNESDDETI